MVPFEWLRAHKPLHPEQSAVAQHQDQRKRAQQPDHRLRQRIPTSTMWC